MPSPDSTDEQILKLYVALVDEADSGMRGQINKILMMTKGRFVGVNQQGEVRIEEAPDEVKRLWKHDLPF